MFENFLRDSFCFFQRNYLESEPAEADCDKRIPFHYIKAQARARRRRFPRHR